VYIEPAGPGQVMHKLGELLLVLGAMTGLAMPLFVAHLRL